jgi:hypothetical protein
MNAFKILLNLSDTKKPYLIQSNNYNDIHYIDYLDDKQL